MPRRDELEQTTIREAFTDLTVDDLKPLAALVATGQPPTRKGDLVDLLTSAMEDSRKVRALYASLADLYQKALQEATHDLEGILSLEKFEAKYGATPDFGGRGRRYGKGDSPSRLRLFFPGYYPVLPHNLQKILEAFVPEPPALKVNTCDELPPKIRPRVTRSIFRGGDDEVEEKVELRIRPRAKEALHDVKAMLRLIDTGEVRVGDKTRRPAQGAMKTIARVLLEGDFYSEADQSTDDWDPAADLRIQSFAWPMLLQAAGLAEAAGTRLQLTAAGRKATARPAHDLIRQVWQKWQKTTLVDEFNRVNVIKGQQSKGRGRGLTAVAPRRQAVVEVLEECPAEKWIAIGELFRLLKALADDFAVAHDPWTLYISELQYGSLGEGGSWETLQGRFVLALVFEYAATLGLVDVAYVSPMFARDDFRDHWGTDELSCLSRYDGLMYLRINPLGAWCLGLAESYEPEVVPLEPLLRVLPNRDVVAADRTLGPADILFLERFAERTSEAVWHLDAGKILGAVEKGMTVAELREFLGAKSQGPLPQTVEVFLDDLAHKTGQLVDLGTARLIACADPHVAQLLAHDRRLRNLCQLAGEPPTGLPGQRRDRRPPALRDLGYVLPTPDRAAQFSWR